LRKKQREAENALFAKKGDEQEVKHKKKKQ
jgi:hypothetical protein